MKIRKVLPRLVKYSLPFALAVPTVSINAGDTFDITIDAPTGSTASGTIELDTSNVSQFINTDSIITATTVGVSLGLNAPSLSKKIQYLLSFKK